jgi:AraC-like DNA-binding protein
VVYAREREVLTIYVDQYPWSDGKWGDGGHMLGTDLDELHAFAQQLGLRRSYFQRKRLAHYDLTRSKRAMALELDATEIGMGEIPDDCLEMNVRGVYVHRGRLHAARRRKRELRDG